MLCNWISPAKLDFWPLPHFPARIWAWVTLVALLLPLDRTLAQSSATPAAIPAVKAIWSLHAPVDKITVGLGTIINKKQKTLLDSGFTTFSQLIVSYTTDSGTSDELFRVACTVKMDAWDEVYEIARLDEQPQRDLARDFKKYVELCLTADIVSRPALTTLASGNKSLHARLQIEQISADQAKKIREWLIRQQSDVMQGLFSHMLQEITLSETIEIDIPIGARPLAAATPPDTTTTGKIGQAQ